jgi:hypothetical protein
MDHIPGTITIYGAFVIHVALAFFALWQRRAQTATAGGTPVSPQLQHSVARSNARHRHAH